MRGCLDFGSSRCGIEDSLAARRLANPERCDEERPSGSRRLATQIHALHPPKRIRRPGLRRQHRDFARGMLSRCASDPLYPSWPAPNPVTGELACSPVPHNDPEGRVVLDSRGPLWWARLRYRRVVPASSLMSTWCATMPHDLHLLKDQRQREATEPLARRARRRMTRLDQTQRSGTERRALARMLLCGNREGIVSLTSLELLARVLLRSVRLFKSSERWSEVSFSNDCVLRPRVSPLGSERSFARAFDS